MSKIDDPYLRERAVDIQDVTRRVIRNLQGKSTKAFLAVTEPHILVAHNLTPSDTATMDRHRVLGMATDLGSRTSHTAIMARSLNIPTVVGLHNVSEKLETGADVLIDGYNGILITNPTAETLRDYDEMVEEKRVVGARWSARTNQPRAMGEDRLRQTLNCLRAGSGGGERRRRCLPLPDDFFTSTVPTCRRRKTSTNVRKVAESVGRIRIIRTFELESKIAEAVGQTTS